MKFLSPLFLLFYISVYSQVGIGTTDPTATLDIDGTVRIRSTQQENDLEIAKDSILVISKNGNVNRTTSKDVYESHIKTAVRGTFSGSGNIAITLGSNVATIPFNNLEFDTNTEFNTSTHIFTAKQDGIYHVYGQINSSGGIAASPDYGIQILKNNTVIVQQNFSNLNISLLGLNLNVTPPIRSVQTLVKLNAGETIRFQLYTSLVSVNLLRSPIDSYFTIHQIR
ncbi:hypothetical protein [Aequorivita echinoideorum]|uniref:C1q domain-containing protein n=1 Tax=Aequorivita echinoideorum TaxID=1549647 RepID=A0ABS5S724_9FLAO|nr:hypothetical protein [Aequorivita echinoideorum]MBT0609017.1 hypothetical protein [Aequorivita echinoideorum]